MNDQEILNELRDIRHRWEQNLEDLEKRCKVCREQIEKNTRLIGLLEEKIYKNETFTAENI
jgi:chaperonin cofactor prefoldin